MTFFLQTALVRSACKEHAGGGGGGLTRHRQGGWHSMSAPACAGGVLRWRSPRTWCTSGGESSHVTPIASGGWAADFAELGLRPPSAA